jgi:hypothetical protein
VAEGQVVTEEIIHIPFICRKEEQTEIGGKVSIEEDFPAINANNISVKTIVPLHLSHLAQKSV